MDVDFNKALELVVIQVQDKIVHKVEAIANNDQRQLVAQAGLLDKRGHYQGTVAFIGLTCLQKVLDFLGIIVVALAADTLRLAYIAGAARRLDVLEVHERILADVDNRAEVVVKT